MSTGDWLLIGLGLWIVYELRRQQSKAPPVIRV